MFRKGFTNEIEQGLRQWFPREDRDQNPICDELRDLMARMVTLDTAQRPIANDYLDHPYFKQVADSKNLLSAVRETLTKLMDSVSSRCVVW